MQVILFFSMKQVLLSTVIFYGIIQLSPKSIQVLRMAYFTPDTFPPKFEKHFFPQNIRSVYSSLRLFTYSCSWFMVSFIPFSLFCCCSESLYSFSCLFETFSSTISIFFLKSFRRSLLSANFSRKAVISLAFALKYLRILLITEEKHQS